MRLSYIGAFTTFAAFSITGASRAQDEQSAARVRPRVYVGVALGQSQLGAADLESTGAPPVVLDRFGNTSPSGDITGWKLAVGFRPVRLVGVELQYLDFGEGEIAPPTGNAIFRAHVDMETSADATVLAALVFLPLRSPSFDVYGKVGVAELDESLRAHALVVVGSPCIPLACNFSSDEHGTDSFPYFGIGVRVAISRAAAFRLEYEAIDRDGDDTTMWSVGVAWER
jgi:hypothetical protein